MVHRTGLPQALLWPVRTAASPTSAVKCSDRPRDRGEDILQHEHPVRMPLLAHAALPAARASSA